MMTTVWQGKTAKGAETTITAEGTTLYVTVATANIINEPITGTHGKGIAVSAGIIGLRDDATREANKAMAQYSVSQRGEVRTTERSRLVDAVADAREAIHNDTTGNPAKAYQAEREAKQALDDYDAAHPEVAADAETKRQEEIAQRKADLESSFIGRGLD